MFEHVEQLLRYARDVLGARRVPHRHRELVAAEARHGIAAAYRAERALVYGEQDLVAHLVAEAVVDVLETVEVEEQDAHAAAVALGVEQRLPQPVGEQDPVRQTGEGVVLREELDALLGALALGDVARDTELADDAALHIALHGTAVFEPAVFAACLMAHTVEAHPSRARGIQL